MANYLYTDLSWQSIDQTFNQVPCGVSPAQSTKPALWNLPARNIIYMRYLKIKTTIPVRVIRPLSTI